MPLLTRQKEERRFYSGFAAERESGLMVSDLFRADEATPSRGSHRTPGFLQGSFPAASTF